MSWFSPDPFLSTPQKQNSYCNMKLSYSIVACLAALLSFPCSAELSEPGSPCWDENDCSNGVDCILASDNCFDEEEGNNNDGTESSPAFRALTRTATLLTSIASTAALLPSSMFAEAATCQNGQQFICDDTPSGYDCPETTNAPSVLLEFTWPGCNKEEKPYGRWETGLHSCTSYGGLNGITGLYQVINGFQIDDRPVYRRESLTATGATLFLFHKDSGWHIVTDLDGVLSSDPSYTASAATVQSNARYVENIGQDAIWKQGYASTRTILATSTCSDKVYTGGNTAGGGGSGGGGGGSIGGGGNCSPSCCSSCNTAGCPSCCC